jgi:hypothetical protein
MLKYCTTLITLISYKVPQLLFDMPRTSPGCQNNTFVGAEQQAIAVNRERVEIVRGFRQWKSAITVAHDLS